MKRLLFVALVCGLATVPSLGTPSLGFWEEGAPGTTHMVWDLGPTTVLQVNQSFDADTSEEASFPAGIVHTPIGVAMIESVGLTYSDGVFSSPNPIDVHLKINNFPAPNAFKEVWVDAVGSGTIDRDRISAIATDGPALSFSYTLLEGPGPGTGADFGYRIQPNPFFEEIHFSIVPAAGTLATLDNIHVDTICTPAPGALLLASLGATVVGWLRTRRSI